MLVTLQKIGEVLFRWLGTIGFLVKAENERCTAAALRCRQNFMKLPCRHLADYVKNCTKKRAARAARLFFLIQPTYLWGCGCRRHFLNFLLYLN